MKVTYNGQSVDFSVQYAKSVSENAFVTSFAKSAVWADAAPQERERHLRIAWRLCNGKNPNEKTVKDKNDNDVPIL